MEKEEDRQQEEEESKKRRRNESVKQGIETRREGAMKV